MFVHAVYFWLKKDLPAADLEKFKTRLHKLLDIPSVRHGFIGTPADTDRPIIDRSYSYGLIVAFDDKAGHDIYQDHPIHDAFRECAPCWTRVLIYDME